VEGGRERERRRRRKREEKGRYIGEKGERVMKRAEIEDKKENERNR